MKYFLRADIIPCKGFKRTALIDIVNSEITFFDNDYYKILHDLYNIGVKSLDMDLLSVLQNDNYLIKAENIDNFPRISLTRINNSLFPIDNCIIDRNSQSKYNIISLLKQLDRHNCKYIQLRFFDFSNEVFDILNYLNLTKSFIQNLEIIIEKSNKYLTQLEELFYRNLRVNKLILYGSEETKLLSTNQGRIFIEVKDHIDNCKTCGIISTNNFFINKYHFKEANNVNTCLFKKISIDVNGEIRNCPSMPQSFGNIKDTTLEEALSHPDFKKYWNLTKDSIEVCKDCEFRYICTDCRAYTERTHINEEGLDISKPLKCGYNTYTGEWEEWSTNPLKEKAIKYYGMEELIKSK